MFSHRVSKLRSVTNLKILGIDIRMKNFSLEIQKLQARNCHVQSHLIILYFENLDKVTCKNGGLHWSISKADFHQYDHGFFRGKCDPVKSRDGTHYEMTIPFGSCGLKRKVWWSNNTIHYMVSFLVLSNQFQNINLKTHLRKKVWSFALFWLECLPKVELILAHANPPLG